MNVCKNTVGSFTCSCTDLGYHLANDMKSCLDIDECVADRHECTDEEICINSIGSFVCVNITQPGTGKLGIVLLM